MAVDIFRFWSQIGPAALRHPADEDVLSRVPHGFDLTSLPCNFGGPLRGAAVVLLYLSPGGVSPKMRREAKSKAVQEHFVRVRQGRVSLPGPDENEPAWRWWSSRTSVFCDDWKHVAKRLAILNVGAYHSQTFGDRALLAALPSSRTTLDWAQTVLFPEAIAGERVVICMRAASYWGLRPGERYGRGLFAASVNRAGYMKVGKVRDEIIVAAQRVLSH